MCAGCLGRGMGGRFQRYLHRIATIGWAVAHVEADAEGAGFSHTVGLTRFHGHPELLVSGLAPEDAERLLAELAVAVRDGSWLTAGARFDADSGHRIQLADVANPRRLEDAQAVYGGEAGLVPGLQIIWSDQSGHWPWDPAWPGTRYDQPLFGLPLHHS